jgi:hypothetical protein
MIEAMKTIDGEHAADAEELVELDRRCTTVDAGQPTIPHEEVARWLETWGTPRSQVSMLIKVIRLEKLGGFRLRVRFNDGREGVHDFSAMVKEPGPMLEPLRDEAYFARVFLEFGAPTWPNGFDIAPEWLRREMEAAGELAPIAAE